MKKLLCLMFAFIFVFSLGSCKTGGGNAGEANLPDYVKNRNENVEYKISSWVGVPNYVVKLNTKKDVVAGSAKEMTDEEFENQYRIFKESGISIMYPGEWKVSATDGGPYSGNYTSDSRFIKRMLATAEKTGVKQMIRDYTLNGILKNVSLTDEEAVAAAQEAVAYYKDDAALYGHLIEDEPVLNEIDVCKLALKRYKMVFPDKVGLVNLCPIIGRAADFTDENWNSEECTAWEYYLDKWLEGETTTDYISYDHYPLLGSNSTGKTSIEPTFIVSMQYVAQRAKATNREMWTYLQSIGYGGANRIPTSAADISFQAYTFLAYGGKQISWFCYWSPIRYDGLTHFTEAMIELDGTKTAVYDYVKEINREILAFDDIYDNFEWQGSMTKVGRENAMGENDNFEYVAKYVMTSHPRIEKYTAEQDTLIGVFKDKAGKEDGFMVVNFTDPAKNLSNKIEITFKDTNYAAVVVDGELTTIKLNNGVLKLNLDSGDGAFVIPLK